MESRETYDIFLIHEEDIDNGDAHAFKYLIENNLFIQSRKARVCMSNDDSFICVSSKFQHCEYCITYSKLVFLFVTPAFLKNKQWVQMRTLMALKKKIAVFPIIVNVDPQIVEKLFPCTFYHNLSELLQGNSLQDIMNDEYGMDRIITSTFWKNIEKLVNQMMEQ